MKKINEFKLILKNANEKDLRFLIGGIKEICKIEKQKPKKDRIIMKNIKEAIKNKKMRVVKICDKTVGFVQFTFSNKEPYGLNYGKRKRFCWIEYMYIAKNYRGKGIGKLLHRDIVKICKNNNIKEIMLDVFEVNKKAKKFYEEENFNNFIHILREEI